MKYEYRLVNSKGIYKLNRYNKITGDFKSGLDFSDFILEFKSRKISFINFISFVHSNEAVNQNLFKILKNFKDFESFWDWYNTHKEYENLSEKYTLKEIALHGGYINRGFVKIENYHGKHGQGKKVYLNNPNSSRYCIVEYWIEK